MKALQVIAEENIDGPSSASSAPAKKPARPDTRGCTLGNGIRALRGAVLDIVELTVIGILAVWTIIGLFAHARDTGWKLSGLLTMLHDQWRGALILGGLLFYRTIRESLDRLNLRKIKTPVGELDIVPTETMPPGKEQPI